MHPPNHRPTEMYLGTSDERRDLLRQQARNRRSRAALYTMLVVVLLGILAAIFVGPGRAIDWLGTYLVPVAAILAMGVCVLVLLVRLINKIPFPRGWNRD
jgi:uncharacterized membrane protein